MIIRTDNVYQHAGDKHRWSVLLKVTQQPSDWCHSRNIELAFVPGLKVFVPDIICIDHTIGRH